ncbi:Short-chain dehydrogenase/reductase family 16C member 6 [Trichostrongylus colubriformis]|uniref:Short-chain dehydrogenase/reductase family 16C member 6 n=1 Tax=Trichostrongylus colubriformis TaxID=6319 RepID=A0AAN8IEY7_TRICO
MFSSSIKLGRRSSRQAYCNGDGAAKTFGKVDIVICNAAVLTLALFKDLTVNQLRHSMDVNILGTINTIRAFIEPMEERNCGQIVAVSSIAGFYGETFGLAYCPTKFAVRGIMECLQMELRDRGLDGIVCTTLCPYFSRTPMILREGIRPKCTWFPFMSVESCSRRMVDAILKEKCTYFMPNYVTVPAMLKGLLSVNAGRSLRDYLGIEFAPPSGITLPGRRTSSAAEEYFCSPDVTWWLLILTLLPIILNGYFVTPIITLVIAINFTQAVYTLLLCDEMRFSFACAAKWFMQTVCVGYPSLRILMEHVRHVRKTATAQS